MSKNNELEKILNEQDVPQENAKQLLEAFGAPFHEAGEILAGYQSIKVTSEDQTELMQEARDKRLALKKTRVEVEHKRKELKADFLKTGRAIDSVAKFVKEIIEPAEAYLELQEKYAEIQAQKRHDALKAKRIEALQAYQVDVSVFNFDTMSEAQFDYLIARSKAEFERVRNEAIRQDEERKRIAAEEAAEQQRIREENARLKAEAEAREAELAKEREAEAKRQAAIEAERQKELQAEREKAEVERQKREALETEQRQKEEEARRAEQLKAEEEAKALLAPDKTKLVEFANGLDIVRTTKLPAVKNNQAQQIVNRIEANLAKLANAIRDEAKEL